MIGLDPADCMTLVASPRWAARVADGPDGCLVWVGARTSKGYGAIWLGERKVYAHRVAWVAANGQDVPPGMQLDHLCRTRGCVNPDHLEPVTARENVARGVSMTAHAARTGFCARGHELAGDNLRRAHLARGKRACLACHRDRNRQCQELVMAAARALGLTRHAYTSAYGHSRATAEQILAATRPGQLALWEVAA